MSCTRLESGTATTSGLFGGTCGRSVGGFGPAAFQAPKYFSMTAQGLLRRDLADHDDGGEIGPEGSAVIGLHLRGSERADAGRRGDAQARIACAGRAPGAGSAGSGSRGSRCGRRRSARADRAAPPWRWPAGPGGARCRASSCTPRSRFSGRTCTLKSVPACSLAPMASSACWNCRRSRRLLPNMNSARAGRSRPPHRAAPRRPAACGCGRRRSPCC